VDKFQDKYRIESHRLYDWDYSVDGIYFITLVINSLECILGEIRNYQMFLSQIGCIVQGQWLKSFEKRNELFLDEYTIMPNHIHGLVVLKKNILGIESEIVEKHGRASLHHKSTELNFPRQS
jgi:REP element-mobilizing transposase RayT